MPHTFAAFILSAVAALAITVIVRLLYDLERQRRKLNPLRRARLMYEAALRLSGTLEIEEIYSGLRELTARAIPCDGMIVSSYDAASGLVRCVYLWVNGKRLDHSTARAAHRPGARAGHADRGHPYGRGEALRRRPRSGPARRTLLRRFRRWKYP